MFWVRLEAIGIGWFTCIRIDNIASLRLRTITCCILSVYFTKGMVSTSGVGRTIGWKEVMKITAGRFTFRPFRLWPRVLSIHNIIDWNFLRSNMVTYHKVTVNTFDKIAPITFFIEVKISKKNFFGSLLIAQWPKVSIGHVAKIAAKFLISL